MDSSEESSSSTNKTIKNFKDKLYYDFGEVSNAMKNSGNH